MSVAALTSFPCSFEAGNTVIVQTPFSGYLPASWTLTLYLSLNGAAPTAITATSSGSDFIFTISATVSAALAPGDYQYAVYAVAGSERTNLNLPSGQITVTPNLAAAITPTFAQAQVTLLETVLAAFNATTKMSVSFNGQSFTRANVGSYRQEWAFWKARVIAEQEVELARRGVNTSKNYAPSFGTPGVNPFSICGGC